MITWRTLKLELLQRYIKGCEPWNYFTSDFQQEQWAQCELHSFTFYK